MGKHLELIPVIDLMHGHVVHARLGLRAHYQPLHSPLAHGSSEPLQVVDGLLNLHAFKRLYIADLDAIVGEGDHITTMTAIQQRHPGVELWVDSGIGHPPWANPAPSMANSVVVLGSESMRELPNAGTQVPVQRWVLSLDFRNQQLVGPCGLLEQAEIWPDDVIVMTLDRVGGNQGPDLQLLRTLQRRAPTRRLYAAGGVRDAEDLTALAQAGAHGVLLASSLHDGRLRAADVQRHADG